MKVTRRSFLKYCAGSAAVLGLDLGSLGALEKALAAGNSPPVVWISGSSCTGCTVSLANRISPSGPAVDVADLLLNTIDLVYHPTLMAATGKTAVASVRRAMSGPFILAVEGGIPTAYGGHACVLCTVNGREITALQAVRYLAPRAMAVLSIGTCSSFGGVAAASPNPTGVRTVGAVAGVPTINIPGCPTHPDWVVWTIAQLLLGNSPALDAQGRPADLFAGEKCNVHKRCPRREGADEAEQFGLDGYCLEELGCKGPVTQADCPTRKWNNGENWCVGANSICIGCTEKGFPDRFSPFYRELEEEEDDHDSDHDLSVSRRRG